MEDRRRFFRYVLATAGAAIAGSGARAAEAHHLPTNMRRHKVVYHLNEGDLAINKRALRNIRFSIGGLGGPQNIEAAELVVHGEALKNFVTKGMDLDLKKALESLQLDGLHFGACGNTMKAFKIALEELVQGANYLPQGGVARIIELQEEGYIYIRS